MDILHIYLTLMILSSDLQYTSTVLSCSATVLPPILAGGVSLLMALFALCPHPPPAPGARCPALAWGSNDDSEDVRLFVLHVVTSELAR